ncbi:restriction system protein [Tessaracoccus bendigoensis DSM 12906]|uniref:Restriction system protein n=2 Tax=Tessaracoccus TaxID=72763 RepID=A0A1M6G596_9ACTN|nr:restriction system protein [Tessaracoccus bendigoensis DSM 12906]
MIHTLRALADGNVRSRRELFPLAARLADLTVAQQAEVLSSGQVVYENRVGWALSFLANVGAMERPSRGHYQITDAGRGLLQRFPQGFRERDVNELADDPESPIRPYVASAPRPTKQGSAVADPAAAQAATMTPTEQVQDGIGRIHADVAGALLSRLQSREPAFFERAVVELLLAMGYGGVGGSGAVTQMSNDGGIDGVIDQDVLGLSRVYLQAKRYADGSSVGRPEVQGFVGAVHGKADGGVFITTSHFSKAAREFAEITPMRIILIDGQRLTDLMIRYGVGVQVRQTFVEVEIDEDFFA